MEFIKNIIDLIIKTPVLLSATTSIFVAIIAAHLLNKILKKLPSKNDDSRIISIIEMFACFIIGGLMTHAWIHKFFHENPQNHSNDHYFLTIVFIIVTFMSIIIYASYNLFYDYLHRDRSQ